jgi:hypothetical protein
MPAAVAISKSDEILSKLFALQQKIFITPRTAGTLHQTVGSGIISRCVETFY